MGTLVRIEIGKACRSRLARLALVVSLAIAVTAAAMNIAAYLRILPLMQGSVETKYAYPFAYSPYCDWLPVDGFTSLSLLFFFVAPLLVALGYSWSLRAELRSGWAQQALARVTRRRYYAAKWIAAFVAGGTVAALPLAVNFLVLACAVPLHAPDVNDVLYIGMYASTFMSQLFYQCPLAYVAARTVLDFVLAGLWAAAVLGVSVWVRNRVAVVVLPYVAMVIVKFVSERLYIMAGTGDWRQSFTLLDLLRAHGDAFDYGWVAVGVAALAMLALSIVPPLLARGRDVL